MSTFYNVYRLCPCHNLRGGCSLMCLMFKVSRPAWCCVEEMGIPRGGHHGRSPGPFCCTLRSHGQFSGFQPPPFYFTVLRWVCFLHQQCASLSLAQSIGAADHGLHHSKLDAKTKCFFSFIHHHHHHHLAKYKLTMIASLKKLIGGKYHL